MDLFLAGMHLVTRVSPEFLSFSQAFSSTSHSHGQHSLSPQSRSVCRSSRLASETFRALQEGRTLAVDSQPASAVLGPPPNRFGGTLVGPSVPEQILDFLRGRTRFAVVWGWPVVVIWPETVGFRCCIQREGAGATRVVDLPQVAK